MKVYPEIPTEAARKIKERDEIRNNNPQSDQLRNLNKEITNLIINHKKEKWKSTVENIDPSHPASSTKLFKLIKRLNGRNISSGNQPIKFKGKYISCPAKLANCFNKQYSSVVHHKSSKESRKIKKEILKNKLSDEAQLYCDNETKEAIKKSKNSKAIGPDKISNLHLKHLGPKGIAYLTKIFNLSIKTSQIPSIWKTSLIIPLLKPGKDAKESKSYRPVSLLCPSIKILERLLLPTLDEHLEVPNFQHGFRKNHSTVTALHDFNQDINTGFNKKCPPDRTVLVQLDLSKAFDMVSHDKLIKSLNDTTLPPNVKRWMNSYLRGRTSRVKFRDKTSSSRNVRVGVPQGAVSSPLLFSFYLSKIPTPPEDVKIIQYADDISIYSSDVNINTICNRINPYLESLASFLEERELLVSPEKSTVTLFTPDTKEAKIHPKIQLKNTTLPLEKTPKLLGVIFDTMHSFSHNVKASITKVKPRLNILKSLAGSDWGQEKETMVLTYKSIGRSVLEYGNPIWGPQISDSNWEKLQIAQNQALRIATGCLAMTGEDHLHQETKVLPIHHHSNLLSTQFLLSTHLPGHPGQKHLDRPPPERNIKTTVMDFKNKTRPLLPIGDKKEYKKGIKKLHTNAVSEAKNKCKPNKVLNANPPSINNDELKLKRVARTQLAQLRSGYSRLVNDYKSRIDPEIQNICPECKSTPHNVHHLFNCPKNPTSLKPIDLWKKPIQVARFLKLDET